MPKPAALASYDVAKTARSLTEEVFKWAEFEGQPPGVGIRFREFGREFLDFAKLVGPVLISHENKAARESARVPLFGEYLLKLFLSARDREAIPGDLEEEFFESISRYGLGPARVWYWTQVIWSIGPIVAARASKAMTMLAELLKWWNHH
jgi:hypothetical protein